MLENNPGCEVSMREEYCIGLPSTMTKILPVGISAKCWLLLEVIKGVCPKVLMIIQIQNCKQNTNTYCMKQIKNILIEACVRNSLCKCHVASVMFVQIWTGPYCTHQENPKKILLS
jgi:hypothetical protein